MAFQFPLEHAHVLERSDSVTTVGGFVELDIPFLGAIEFTNASKRHVGHAKVSE